MFGKKKKLLAGDMSVYAVYDIIAKHYLRLYFNSTDEEFVRLYLPEVIIDRPLRDIEVFKIGELNDVTGIIKPTVKRKVDLHCYMFPHSRLSPKGEDVSIEDVEKIITETKLKIQTSVEKEKEVVNE